MKMMDFCKGVQVDYDKGYKEGYGAGYRCGRLDAFDRMQMKPIVYCKDCKHYVRNGQCEVLDVNFYIEDYHYCAWAIRKENDE